MKNIKVTVEYEIPKTNKFDALLVEYKIAKKIADEAESYYKPLAELAEEAKFDAIMHQLEPIKYYAQQISQLCGHCRSVWIKATIPYSERNDHDYACGSGDFIVEYFPKEKNFRIRWGGMIFDKERFNNGRCNFCSGSQNVIGNWDKWRVYQRLEEDAIKKLNELIQKQTERQQRQINRLKNVQGDI